MVDSSFFLNISSLYEVAAVSVDVLLFASATLVVSEVVVVLMFGLVVESCFLKFARQSVPFQLLP